MKFLKNNVRRIFKSIAVVLLVTTFISSCKKDKEVISNGSSIEGKWVGKEGFGPVTDDDLLLNIKQGGIIEETNAAGAVKGSGTWTLSGTSFIAHYKFKAPLLTTYRLTGTYDKSIGKITGTWGFDDGDDDEGNFYVNKK